MDDHRQIPGKQDVDNRLRTLGCRATLRKHESKDCHPLDLQADYVAENFLTAACTGSNLPLRLLFVFFSNNSLRFKNQASEKLRSEEGQMLTDRRIIEPDPVFGNIKKITLDSKGFCFEAYPK
ncbi:hypothetical protein [Paenibacillus sp. Soil750]|uniref:hypothetical protein n=1 Tax=Paenibacillus sp. Soil750 TaxID=1736398 RepID=UPI0006F5DDAA|nr:hypothetical protein [Paenibacillus sp. Soil750]KRE72898.1 hypothetical protein ASL11_07605 [Paenibacillus sp. Soil750]